ncbi:hypothetical protein D9M68_210000 [compost metagenome]
MARPLRKLRPDGSLYARRPAVEAEISVLQDLGGSDLVSHCRASQKEGADWVSPEAVLHFLRQGSCSVEVREQLMLLLLERLYRRLPKPNSSNGQTASLTTTNIRDDVCDRFVDLLLGDADEYDERLDFYEINFNQALACDILDAKRKHWTIENRGTELGSEDEEISAHVEEAAGQYDPFDPEELDKKDYRRRLQDAIDTLPELQQQIVEMWRQDIPIDSSDPSVMTISKALERSEKTIRTHRDKAFASLRRRLERKENTR